MQIRCSDRIAQPSCRVENLPSGIALTNADMLPQPSSLSASRYPLVINQVRPDRTGSASCEASSVQLTMPENETYISQDVYLV
jgi:hypothetical protein